MANASKIIKSSLGLIGSGIGAYTNLSPIEDVEQYNSQAQQLGNSNYQLGSLQSLADQYAQQNIPQSITGKDLYNPSAGERFGQLFGSGLSGFMSGYNFADNFTDDMGKTFIQGGSGYNTASGKGYGDLGKAIEEQVSLGRDFSGSEGINMLMQEFNVPGAKWANGGMMGMMLNNGSMVNAASGLAMAGINMGLNAIGNARRRKQAELDALKYNALRDFSIDRNNLDFQRAINDSTDNMFNMAALQMKANGGKIYIKPSKRGTFTTAAKSRGMGVQEFASKVLANKEDYSTAMVKKANFARNAAKWHDEGGPLFTNGGIWSNGLTFIGNGGTHEENPFEGVPMGIAPDGIPNLVEEKEVVWTNDEENSYVFSDRLKVSKKMLDKYMLPSKYEGKSYAEVAKELSKESEERPNDPISKKGLEDSMTKLQQAQEEYKAIKDQEKLEKALAKLTPEEKEMLLAQNAEGMPQQAMFDKGGILIRKWDEADGDVEKSNKAEKWLETLEALPSTLMRYTPTLIQGIQALKGNKVDYTNPNLIAANTRNINFTPLGDYMALERLPFVSTIGNKMQAQQAATNAAIQNVAANRAAAIPSLLTSSYQGQTALADAALEAAKYNNMLAQTEAEFNRGTNQTNLTAGLDVAKANQQLAYQSAAQQAAMREAIDQYISASDSANMSNFMESLQNIGRENLDKKALQELIASGIFGAMSDKQKTALSRGNAYGGKLKRNKRKGLTC